MDALRPGAVILAALALALVAPPARAHVGPSPEANNRYVTIVLEPGAARVHYALFFGDRPGSVARARMDRTGAGDGVISDAERDAFADDIARRVGEGLEVSIDREAREITWDRVDIAMDTRSVEGGAFSIELLSTFCFEPEGEHALKIRDAFRVPPVGEGSLALEEGEVEVLRAAMGDGDGVRGAYKWMGRGQLAEEGYNLEFHVPEGADVPPACEDLRTEAPELAIDPDGSELRRRPVGAGPGETSYGSQPGGEAGPGPALAGRAGHGHFGSPGRAWGIFAATTGVVMLGLGVALLGIRRRD